MPLENEIAEALPDTLTPPTLPGTLPIVATSSTLVPSRPPAVAHSDTGPPMLEVNTTGGGAADAGTDAAMSAATASAVASPNRPACALPEPFTPSTSPFAPNRGDSSLIARQNILSR